MLAVLCQDIHAGVVPAKQGKPKNSTNPSPATTKPKHHTNSKTKASASTTSPTTTVKPQQPEPTTTKPLATDVDGRNAFVNNQFIADQEPIQDNSSPLYEILQKQMEKVLSNTGFTGELYADSPQGKEMIDEGQNAPGKPLFSYNMNQFNDYDEDTENENEEDTVDQEDQQQPENCEDTDESLIDRDDEGNTQQYPNTQPNPQIAYQQSNAPQNSYNQNKPSSNNNKPSKGPYDSSNYNSPSSNYGQSSKPHHKPQSSYNQNAGHKPSQEKPKPPKTSHNKPSKLPASLNNQESPRPQKPSHTKPTQPPVASAEEPSSTSPFSTPTINTSNVSKPSSKRHLTFRTVSSSTQYVSTPLADLMLKFSIGMAKPAKSQGDGTTDNQIYDKNDIELRAF